jgi:hypothetical protein
MKRQLSIRNPCWRYPFALLGVIVLLDVSLTSYAQGFGMIKKDMHMYRKHPPRIFIQSSNVAVRPAADGDPSALSYAPVVRDAIEEIIKKNGGIWASRWMFEMGHLMDPNSQRFVINNQNPEAIIYYSITRLNTYSSWKKGTKYETKKVGEKEELDEKKQKPKKRDVYERVAVEYRIKALTGFASVKIEVRDAKSNELIGSQSVHSNYNKEFKEGLDAPEEKDLPLMLLKELEDKLAACLFPNGDAVKVMLPKGKFEDISDMIEKGQLEAARKSLDTMPVMKNPQDEAYRVYSYGALSEVQAYKIANGREAKQHLQEAVRSYAKAMEMKPDEKYFQSAKIQAEESIGLYTKLEEQAAAYRSLRNNQKKPSEQITASTPQPNQSVSEKVSQETAGSVSRELQPTPGKAGKEPVAKSSAALSDKKSAAPSTATSTLTNEVIIKLVQAGLSEENIIATIQESQSNNFDLSADALVKLLQAKVTNRIISAMRQAKKSK